METSSFSITCTTDTHKHIYIHHYYYHYYYTCQIMSDYVCPPIGSIKKSECVVACAPQSVSPRQCRLLVSLIEVFGANLPRVDSVPTQHGSIDGGRRLELRAQVPLSTRRNGVPGNEHDAKSWGARPTEGRSLIQVAACRPSLRQMAIVCLTHEASEAARHAQVATADADRGTRVSIFGRSPAGGNRYPLSLAIADADGADGRGRRQREYQRSLCRNEMAF